MVCCVIVFVQEHKSESSRSCNIQTIKQSTDASINQAILNVCNCFHVWLMIVCFHVCLMIVLVLVSCVLCVCLVPMHSCVWCCLLVSCMSACCLLVCAFMCLLSACLCLYCMSACICTTPFRRNVSKSGCYNFNLYLSLRKKNNKKYTKHIE